MPSAHTPCRARACHGSPQPCPPIQHPRAPPPPNPQPSTTACVSRSAATSAAPSAASWSEAAAPCFYSAKRPCSDSLRAVQLHRSFQPTAQPALCALCHPCALRFSPRQQAFVISWRHASNDSLQYSKARQEFGTGWEDWGAHTSAGVGAITTRCGQQGIIGINIAAQIKGLSSLAKVGRIRLAVVLSLGAIVQSESSGQQPPPDRGRTGQAAVQQGCQALVLGIGAQVQLPHRQRHQHVHDLRGGATAGRMLALDHLLAAV